MGKNPGAKKQKQAKHKEREFDHDMNDLEEEAALKGVEVWELKKLKKNLPSSDHSEEEGEHEEEKKEDSVPETVKEAKEEAEDKEEESEPDSADEELEKLYGVNTNRKRGVVEKG